MKQKDFCSTLKFCFVFALRMKPNKSAESGGIRNQKFMVDLAGI